MRPRAGTRLALVALAGAAWAVGAQAARPFNTEDAGVLERGECEFEPVWAREKPRGEAAASTSSVQVACGVGRQTQLALNGARTRGADAHETAATVAGKSRWIDGGERGLSVALAWAAVFSRPEDRGMCFEHSAVSVVGTLPLTGGTTLHGNLGVAHSRAESRSAGTWSFAVEQVLGGGWDVGVEAYGQAREDAWLGTGLRWTLSERLSLNASLATQPRGDRSRAASLGLKLNF